MNFLLAQKMKDVDAAREKLNKTKLNKNKLRRLAKLNKNKLQQLRAQVLTNSRTKRETTRLKN